MNHTIFDDIVSGNMKSWKVWEDEKFLAFLTPFPNTPGFTVVIPKQNPGDYVFSLDDELYSEMMLAVKKGGFEEFSDIDFSKLDEYKDKLAAVKVSQ
mgnify:FL=1